MSDIKIFTKYIELEPWNLTKDIKTHFKDKINKIKYDKEEGYVFEIFDDYKILDNYIESTSGYCMILVEYKGRYIHPEKGVILTAKVTMKLGEGVLFKFYDMMLWVPSLNIPENKKIELGNEEKLKILETKYEKNEWKCIATLYK